MENLNYIIERCEKTKLFTGRIPGLPGAHSQGATLDELIVNMREVVSMLLEDDEPSRKIQHPHSENP
jgi:predicted RNase H-like HicB family nuclease